MPREISTYLEEQKVSNLYKAAVQADDYALTHKCQSTKQFVVKENNSKPNEAHSIVEKNVSSESKQGLGFPKYFKPVHCAYCKKKGHLISDCWTLKRKKNTFKPIANVIEVSTDKASDKTSKQKETDCSTPKELKPFIFDGTVSLPDVGQSQRIKILRDTGATQSLILQGTLPFSDESSLHESVLISGVEGGIIQVPLHSINLKSDLVSGNVTVGVRPTLPVSGISMLLGNDLAGGNVMPQPRMLDVPLKHEDNCHESSLLFPSCVVTRAQAKLQDNADESLHLEELFDEYKGQPCKENRDPQTATKSQMYTETTGDKAGSATDQMLNKRQLVLEQEKDPSLQSLYFRAVTEYEAKDQASCYYVKDKVMMRKWRPPTVPADEEWNTKYQIVTPQRYRSEILRLAHDSPMAGHLGIRKTADRVLKHFYWPGIRRDITHHCKTCHTCQMVGKPNQKIPQAPLKPIPAFEEPFSKIIIDCVGPLPKTRTGCQYLLTIMCASSRFPEAIPLRNITSKTIVKELTKFFTTYGLPKEVQHDQGTNFMSRLFQEAMNELGIKQIHSSAYHPESQGALERFHQTLKNMMRTYCFENEKDWDEGVPLLLFGAREVVQESLGFSPFELVFAHEVRGPLKLMKETLLDENNHSNLLIFVSNFKDRLRKACQFAKQNLEGTQKSMKTWYDRKSKERNFSPGDKVLVLLPVKDNCLSARYHGPYTITTKINDTDYVINTADRRKTTRLCHINMLKEFYEGERKETVLSSCSQEKKVLSAVNEDEMEEIGNVEGSIRLKNSEVLNNLKDKLSHLPQHFDDLKELMLNNRQLFSDVPSRTTVVQHDIDVGDAIPIKQSPYRVNPTKMEQMNKEVEYMLDNDIIELSQSSWSSPCLLVPKPDKTFRFCTDFRKVNSLTKTDSFPIPHVESMIDQVGYSSNISKIDVFKGYWQVPLTDRAKEISAMVTPQGLFQYKVMAFGLKNAPATFQRLMNTVTASIPNCSSYIDDIILYHCSWKEHLQGLSDLFSCLTEANLTINLAKSEFGKATVTYLGHEIGHGKVRPVKAKTEAVINFPEPTNKKELQRFLGMMGYWRKFCKNFSDVSLPLTALTQKDVPFVWTEDCQKSFQNLKAVLTNPPVLAAPNFSKPFKLMVDASDLGCGGVLLQEDEAGVEHPVSFYSKKFSSAQRNYSTIEKECLALLMSLQHFEVYIDSSQPEVEVYTDHNPLTFINKMKNKNQRLLRWSISLQQYNLVIKHIKGKDNICADALSREH